MVMIELKKMLYYVVYIGIFTHNIFTIFHFQTDVSSRQARPLGKRGIISFIVFIYQGKIKSIILGCVSHIMIHVQNNISRNNIVPYDKS